MSDITVVLPNWNKAPYLALCLDSLLGQTLGDFKCIIVDGKSTDGSLDLIHSYLSRDSRLSLYPDPGKGLYAAWNAGLSEVRTSLFSILTSDDLWPKNFLEAMLKSLKDNSQAIACAARVRIIDSDGNPGDIAIHNQMGEQFFGKENGPRRVLDNAIANYFLGPIYTSIHSLLIRRSVLDVVGRFIETLGPSADYDFYLRLALAGPVCYRSDVEVNWRVYEGQATNALAQTKNGEASRSIHDSVRASFAALPGMAQAFEREALRYDRSVLHYHYQRPAWRNFRLHPMESFWRLIQTAFSHPLALGFDILAALRKQDGYFIQASARVAQDLVKQCSG